MPIGIIKFSSKFTLFFVVLLLLVIVFLYQDEYKAKKLYNTASKGDVEEVRKLVKDGIPLNSALIFALDVLDKNAIHLLIKEGATVKEIGNEYLTRSLYKAKHNRFTADYLDLTQLMIENKVDLNRPSDYYYEATPLMGAVRLENISVISALLKVPVDINVVGKNCETAIFEASNLQIANLLLENGANINHENCKGANALVSACKEENLALIDFYISKGAKINSYDNSDNRDCLLYGIEKKNKAMIDLMIQNGANVNYSDANPLSPLTFAVQSESIEMVDYLLSKGADVNAKDGNGNLSLILAAAKEDIPLVKYLLEHKADVHMKDAFGNNALELAEISKNEKLIRILKHAGVSKLINNRE